MTKDKRNNRRAGFYWIKDDPYLSVTELLGKTIPKPALTYWFGQQVYYAMAQDPSLDEKTALASPYQASAKAKDRGATVHSLIEAYKNTGERIEEMPVAYQGYATAFYDFMRDHKPEILEQEKTVISDKYKLAGTLDMYIKLGDKYMIADVKTGKEIYMESGLQLSAYATMLRDEGKKVDEIVVILLETGKDGLPTGKYKFQTMIEDFKAILACKYMYKYLYAEKLLKVGYKG